MPSETIVARRAMACEFSLAIPAGVSSAVEAGCCALDVVDRLEERLSVYSEESDLSSLNRRAAEEPVAVDEEMYGWLRAAAGISRATEGAFDPAAGALVKAWGFFRGPRRVPCANEHRTAVEQSGCRWVRFDSARRTIVFLRPGVEFNLGAIGKGLAIDTALRVARDQFSLRRVLMQGGQSSFRALGAPNDEPAGWPVTIGNPCREGESIGKVALRDRALGTSGAAHQYFVHDGRRFGHILDPRTGWPAHKLLSATAIADTAAEADAFSTAFFVLGVEGTLQILQTRPRLGAVLVLPGKTKGRGLEILRLGTARTEVTL